MFSLLREWEVRVVDRCSRVALLNAYDFIEVRYWQDVPVYAPADQYCREAVFTEAYAFTYGEGIFVEYKTYARDVELMAHEYEHIEQLRRWGAVFGPAYWLDQLVNGYEQSLFEQEANLAEKKMRLRRLRRKTLSS